MSTFNQSRSQAFQPGSDSRFIFSHATFVERYISILILLLIIRVISISTVQPRKYLVRLHDEIRMPVFASPPPLFARRARDEWRQREAQINVDKSGQIYIVASGRRWERESRPFCITRVDKTRFHRRWGRRANRSATRDKTPGCVGEIVRYTISLSFVCFPRCNCDM